MAVIGGYNLHLVQAYVSKVSHDAQVAAQGEAASPRRAGPLYGTHRRQARAVDLQATIN